MPGRAQGQDSHRLLTSVSQEAGSVMASSTMLISSSLSHTQESLMASMALRTMTILSAGWRYSSNACGRKEGRDGVSHRVP